jgi:transketolase
MGAKLRGTNQKTYALVGDGEINEGPIWEGALFASHHALKNFMVIVDENGFQAMGSTQDVLNLGSIQAKFESFGFEAVTIDGHDEAAIDTAISQLWASKSSAPKALIAKTVKGKGVPFMENNNMWHYTRLDPQTYAQSLAAVAGSNA